MSTIVWKKNYSKQEKVEIAPKIVIPVHLSDKAAIKKFRTKFRIWI